MLIQDIIAAVFIAIVVAVICTAAAIKLAKRLKVLDYPTKPRKIHKKPIPLMGGIGIYLSFCLVSLLYVFGSDQLTGNHILNKYIWGIIIGGAILMIGGFLDDKYDLPPKLSFIAPVLAVISVIVSGIGIDWITNPFGEGIFYLDKYRTILFWYHGLPYRITILADLFTFVWLMGMMYTTKLLDGIDGLVAGSSSISALFIFFISINTLVDQPDVGLLALIFMGCCLGFLIFNFNPAKVFLGEGGSLYAGFMLGVFSIIAGSKVAVTLMLLAVPILDVAWTIIRRLMEGKHPFKSSDKKHLHHRLLAAGFSQRQTVYALWSIMAIIGGFSLILQGLGAKFLVLGIGVIILFILLIGYLYKRNLELNNKNLTE